MMRKLLRKLANKIRNKKEVFAKLESIGPSIISYSPSPLFYAEKRPRSIFVERELRQRRIVEKWSVNMLSQYYDCTEDEMRDALDYFKIR